MTAVLYTVSGINYKSWTWPTNDVIHLKWLTQSDINIIRKKTCIPCTCKIFVYFLTQHRLVFCRMGGKVILKTCMCISFISIIKKKNQSDTGIIKDMNYKYLSL